MNRFQEIPQKLILIREMLTANNLNGVVIRKQANFSWLTAGGRGFIGFASEMACACIVVTGGHFCLAANNIESRRLLDEELKDVSIDSVVLPWHNDYDMNTQLSWKFGELTDDTAMDAWFKQSRVLLCASEIERYEQAGAQVAQLLERVCMETVQSTTEFEIAGEISKKMWCAGLEPITVLVAADERSKLVRHYVPTAKQTTEGFIASVCIRAGGLVVSATRAVAFTDGFAKRYNALLRVEQVAFDMTRKGSSISDVLSALKVAYKQNGLPQEWENHHQGGVTGYLAREYRADDKQETIICNNMTFAWNPSAVGAKCEDTILLQDGAIKILTPSAPGWPVVQIGEYIRPDILRHRKTIATGERGA